MTKRSNCPADLSITLQQRWIEAGHDPAALPESSALESLIDTAYQASLLREEDDPVQCRVLVASPDDPELKEVEKADGLFVIPFDDHCEFTAHQVRKMAAALGYYRSLVGVQVDPDQDGLATIWGMIVTGTHWVNHTEVTVHDAVSLPHRLVIHILGPGHLVFSSGLKRIVETIGGQILMEGFDPFRSKWLPKHFELVRAALIGKIEASSLKETTVKLCDSFARDVAQNVMRRVLRLVRARGHGGMLIYLNDENDTRLDNWLRIRMRFKHADATNRFQQLMFELMQRALEVGEANGIAEVRWKDFLQMHDASLSKLHDSLVEFSHFLSDLMGVDGCLVLNRELRLIGFGGEILGDSHVSCIERAIDLEGVESVTEPADASGTRHRSAYRLVSSVQDAIVVVVSQDGGVRFVAHRGGRLVYWPYLP
jgi:DisA bacterial checkpoint controller nucleotide-binding